MTCPHGMPGPASCFECMEDGNLPPAPRPKLTIEYHRLTANRLGHCPECDLPIHPGQTIRLWSDQRWRHIDCTPAEATP